MSYGINRVCPEISTKHTGLSSSCEQYSEIVNEQQGSVCNGGPLCSCNVVFLSVLLGIVCPPSLPLNCFMKL
jgi:hypothetical protein